jgi:hypothetical protein
MPDEQGRETEEEARERVAQVRATQIFGDTPTDPTIGDVVVPAHDEEAANLAAAEVADQAEEGDEEAADLSPEEAKRQLEPLDADEVDESAEEQEESDDPNGLADSTSPEADDSDEEASTEKRNVDEVVADIEKADSADEVDRLEAERSDSVTVRRAAEKKRSSWG